MYYFDSSERHWKKGDLDTHAFEKLMHSTMMGQEVSRVRNSKPNGHFNDHRVNQKPENVRAKAKTLAMPPTFFDFSI